MLDPEVVDAAPMSDFLTNIRRDPSNRLNFSIIGYRKHMWALVRNASASAKISSLVIFIIVRSLLQRR